MGLLWGYEYELCFGLCRLIVDLALFYFLNAFTETDNRIYCRIVEFELN